MPTPDYEFAVPFNRHLWSYSVDVGALVEYVYDKIVGALGDCVKRHGELYQNNLRVVLLNLAAAHETNPKLFVSYSRNERKYEGAIALGNTTGVTAVLIRIVDLLLVEGYIADDHKKGFKPLVGTGRESRMRASEKLAKWFGTFGVTTAIMAPQRDEIELRAPKTKGKKGQKIKGKLLPVPDNEQVRRMRANVQRINKMLLSASISLDLTPTERDDLEKRLKRKGRLSVLLRTAKTVRRVFNDGKLNRGGRFYGHWVQGLPKEYRKKVRINGEKVAEWDFGNQHPHMLYALSGHMPPTGDLYRIHGYTDPEARKVVKKVFNALLNADAEDKALKKVLGDLVEESKQTYIPMRFKMQQLKEMCELLKIAHAPIKHHFGTGAGILLQFLDSEIAEKVMLDLIDIGVTAIPIHDSFVVSEKHHDALEARMWVRYRDFLKVSPKTERAY